MYTVTKQFEFAYAHRVWAQSLTNGMKPSCRRLHGHGAKVIVELRQKELQDHEVVLDYNEFKWIKTFLDNTLDHKTLLDISDPILSRMGIELEDNELVVVKTLIPDVGVIDTDFKVLLNIDEYLDSFVLIDGIPTSENFARILFNIFKWKFGDSLYCVTFKESDGTSASYIGDK